MSTFLLQSAYACGGLEGVGCPGKCTFLLKKCTCPWGWGLGWVSGKVHYEHILAGKCTMSTFLLQKCSCL